MKNTGYIKNLISNIINKLTDINIDIHEIVESNIYIPKADVNFDSYEVLLEEYKKYIKSLYKELSISSVHLYITLLLMVVTFIFIIIALYMILTYSTEDSNYPCKTITFTVLFVFISLLYAASSKLYICRENKLAKVREYCLIKFFSTENICLDNKLKLESTITEGNNYSERLSDQISYYENALAIACSTTFGCIASILTKNVEFNILVILVASFIAYLIVVFIIRNAKLISEDYRVNDIFAKDLNSILWLVNFLNIQEKNELIEHLEKNCLFQKTN